MNPLPVTQKQLSYLGAQVRTGIDYSVDFMERYVPRIGVPLKQATGRPLQEDTNFYEKFSNTPVTLNALFWGTAWAVPAKYLQGTSWSRKEKTTAVLGAVQGLAFWYGGMHLYALVEDYSPKNEPIIPESELVTTLQVRDEDLKSYPDYTHIYLRG